MSGAIKAKINLTALPTVAVMTTAKGTRCLMIPIAENHLFESKETKNVYLDITGWENKEDKKDKFGEWQLKQNIPKEESDRLKALDPPQYPASLGQADFLKIERASTPPPIEATESNGDMPF